MVVFERFIAGGNFDIKDFFTAIGVNSDEELRRYCSERGMTTPVKKYFTATSPVAIVEEAKKVIDKNVTKKKVTKTTRAKSVVAPKPAAVKPTEDTQAPVKKSVRKPRTPRGKTTKKTQDK